MSNPFIVRPNWPNLFMNMAHTIAKRSTCLRIQTATLLVKDNRIISIGYNGSVPNAPHCCDYWYHDWKENHECKGITYKEFLDSKYFYDNHHEWSTIHEIHGEQNAILFASRNGISTQGSEMYTVYSPCINCAKVLITAGIKKIYYSKDYKRDRRGILFLESNNISCVQID